MDKKIQECLENRQSGKHILPFFWQHGEDYKLLNEEIEAIYNCGIREFCVESRVHENFGEEKWWDDFEFLLKEAKKRDMRVWLLDDKYFPTGYANNYINDHRELRIKSLRIRYLDYVGPQNDMALLPERLDEGEEYVSIVAYKRNEYGNKLSGEGIDLINNMENGLLWWDIPEGAWRVYYVVKTHRVCSPDKVNYIDMLLPESCKAMIYGVYEPHYKHFSEYFGNTFAGFFSDEPCFGNDCNNYESVLGKEGMLIPWCNEVIENISDLSGLEEQCVLNCLPALWHDIEGKTPTIRECYMETVSKMYSKNFCDMLGDWCREHGVMYIGHMIEDKNTHQRLGYGAGHFFRALNGQDMAGIDIVLNQIIPGHTEIEHTASVFGNTVDPKFFNYTLAKLASSHSHIQTLKKNRAMCEIFGAFGWAEGIPMMKYLADHMLVSGINYFVPHAFTAKYPDTDCPPHFYSHGTNSQYPLFGELIGYMGRMAHVLTDGIHIADVAVYYNAEAEWAGGKYMLQQEVCYKLIRNQIDFDFIPQDTLVQLDGNIVDGEFRVNQEKYKVLIVPYSQYLPSVVIDAMDRISKSGVKVIFVDEKPDCTSEMNKIGDRLNECDVISLDALAEKLIAEGYRSINPRNERFEKINCESLRFYHIIREDSHFIQFWNDSIFDTVDTFVELPLGDVLFYDCWKNKMYKPIVVENEKGRFARIKLKPSEAVLVCVSEGVDFCSDETNNVEFYNYGKENISELNLKWNIYLRDAKENEFKLNSKDVSGLKNLARELPDFAGIIRYETVINISDKEIETINLGKVGEAAMLWINGEYCGSCVISDYDFDIKGKLKTGKNQIRIDVMNNLGYRGRDMFSDYLPLPPSGLLGPIKISDNI